ncbi:helix-turn-helix transcriptional regulator [Verrucosispora sp. NA02020]|uniref:helix-turn-helix domain-containing protein n=1 Tax=Verrucosispora sp. NA02020 TaxID=2742132 RepID=UPI001591B43E|nr:helix-turn-helix transcriptional regulator [Verrucosispora sp. NA02020]QKW13409.1 helix-turn-helix transcriptional regulator [Verrucosispora sp. NA02020]
MESFGHLLRQHRTAAGLSLRDLASRINFQYSHISQVERGERRPTKAMAEACEKALATGGTLDEAYVREAGGSDMRRRSVLHAMGAIAAAPTGDRLVGLEALRHGLTAAVDIDHDEWPEIIAAYGRAYYQQPRGQVMMQLGHDLAVLQHQIAAEPGERRPRLLWAGGQLSIIVALGLFASGQTIAARRWWHTAQRLADESGDRDTKVMVRAWDVVDGSYDGRPAAQVVALSDEALPLLTGQATAATCGLLSGRAQALSLAGRHSEAVATVERLAEQAERLPANVVNDVESLWGWPEHRLRHTESWVYTHANNYRRAEQAQERALALYPASQIRLRTQVELHRAEALIRTGHVPDGLHLAADLLDRLPTSQHNQLVRTVARKVVAAVPDTERRRSSYSELVERTQLTLPD